jgi:hypothetical protein
VKIALNSIEDLLIIFKFALTGGGEHMIEAVWIVIEAALLEVLNIRNKVDKW